MKVYDTPDIRNVALIGHGDSGKTSLASAMLFVAGAVNRLGRARKRNGTYRWGVFEDAAEPGHWIETFLIDSWLEYLRVLERATLADIDLLDEVKRFQQGDVPRVSRFIA